MTTNPLLRIIIKLLLEPMRWRGGLIIRGTGLLEGTAVLRKSLSLMPPSAKSVIWFNSGNGPTFGRHFRHCPYYIDHLRIFYLRPIWRRPAWQRPKQTLLQLLIYKTFLKGTLFKTVDWSEGGDFLIFNVFLIIKKGRARGEKKN